ncbi:MAG: hypothetical protein QY310_03925 [Candidatus Jettenia sp. CY-1]|nr:MAG: hypothetical protein QY310_03925 [Candidatus Jettenia sp. CY-1]
MGITNVKQGNDRNTWEWQEKHLGMILCIDKQSLLKTYGDRIYPYYPKNHSKYYENFLNARCSADALYQSLN